MLEGLKEIQDIKEIEEVKPALVESGEKEEEADETLLAAEVEEKVEEEETLEVEEEEEFHIRPSLQEVTKEFPDLFKKFPALRDMYFREQKLTEVFPTVEEAEAAKEDLEGFEKLELQLSTGKLDDTQSTLKTVKELGEDVLPNLAINFLPALKQIDPNSYYSAVTPILVEMVRTLHDVGTRNSNDNFKNAALVASLHFFGDQEVATGKREVNLPKPKVSDQKDEKDSTVNKEREEFNKERYNALFSDVAEEYESQLTNKIENGLDPDEVMTPYFRTMLIKDIISRINNALSIDRGHKAQMDSLWKKASAAGFSRNWKDRILNAALSRAKTIIPTVRSKARAEALSTKANHGQKVISSGTIKKEALNTGTSKSNNPPSMRQIGNLDPKKIDYSQTSDLDIIQGRVHLKSK